MARKQEKKPVRVITMPYIPLPDGLLRPDGTCSASLFKVALHRIADDFYASIINSDDKVIHLTEDQWLERLKQFAENIGGNNAKS